MFDLLQGNRAIFVESNIHAREWISSATATWIINELLRSTDPAVLDIARNIDWHIVPMANPDGYDFTRSSNRQWRKTRSVYNVLCRGVDPNRNFKFNWLHENLGASTNPCVDTFAGPQPFSESETVAIENYLSGNHGIFDAYLAVSYLENLIFNNN